MNHKYQQKNQCYVCSNCGTSKHKKPWNGFKYWFAGVGYIQQPTCRLVK